MWFHLNSFQLWIWTTLFVEIIFSLHIEITVLWQQLNCSLGEISRSRMKLKCRNMQGNMIVVNIRQKETRKVHKDTATSMQLTL